MAVPQQTISQPESDPKHRAAALLRLYTEVRAATEALCAPLATEDHVIQSIPDVSPPKWHLAHTSWFFENFVLKPLLPGFRPFHPQYHYLFNSYYKSQGSHFERSRRGLLSRPTVEEVYRYRHWVDERLREVLERAPEALGEAWLGNLERVVELGLHHEQQHQELLVTDIKHILWTNPLRPAYFCLPASHSSGGGPSGSGPPGPLPSRVLSFPEGIVRIGAPAAGSDSVAIEFCFDNEKPRHRVFLEAYGIHSRPVSCGEYLEFIEAGGYHEPAHWLSEGWDRVQAERWEAPLYWERVEGLRSWEVFTLGGMRPLDENEPVCHLSYFEADAFARWRGLRLPTEAEWENAAVGWLDSSGGTLGPDTHLAEAQRFHPSPGGPLFFGNVWEWTASAYSPYPGFKPLPSALGEYNGKFMCNQFVLRGGSCATPATHIRPTYRNFFGPGARWQFTGLRLAT